MDITQNSITALKCTGLIQAALIEGNWNAGYRNLWKDQWIEVLKYLNEDNNNPRPDICKQVLENHTHELVASMKWLNYLRAQRQEFKAEVDKISHQLMVEHFILQCRSKEKSVIQALEQSSWGVGEAPQRPIPKR